jgi:hypothetical protein
VTDTAGRTPSRYRRRPKKPRTPVALKVIVPCVLFAIMLLIVRGGSDVEEKLDEESRKVTTDSTADAHEPIVDEDYRFRLDWPGEGWKLLGEEDARKLLPSAVAGVYKDGWLFGVVIVEQADVVDIDAFFETIVESMPLEDKHLVERESVQFVGRRAVRFVLTGQISGIRARYVGYVFESEGHLYQVLGSSVVGRPGVSASGHQPFFDAFSLLPGEVRGREATTSTPDRQGVGWTVENGTFLSAAYGIRVDPPEGWRVAVGAELDEIDVDAEVALVSQKPEAYIVLTAEVIRGVDHDTYSAKVSLGRQEDCVSTGPPVEMSVFGRTVPMKRYRMHVPLAVDYVQGLAFEGDLGVQVVGWSVAPATSRALPRIEAAVAGIRFLEAEELKALRLRLGRAAGRSQVGKGWALRAGRYTNFELGLRWERPEGYWRVTAGQAARAEYGEETLLVFEEPSLGLIGYLTACPIIEVTPEEYHDRVIDEGKEMVGVTDEISSAPIALGEGHGRVSTIDTTPDGVPFRFRHMTAVHGDLGVQISVSGFKGNMGAPEAEAAARDVVRALFLPSRTPPAMETSGSRYTDRRMGYEFDLPGWSCRTMTPVRIKALGSSVAWSKERGMVQTLAVCVFGQVQDMDWFRKFVTQVFREKVGRMAGAAPEQDRSTLGGVPCDRIVWDGDGRGTRAEALLLQRGNIFYCLLAVGPSGRKALDVEALKAGFRLLD